MSTAGSQRLVLGMATVMTAAGLVMAAAAALERAGSPVDKALVITTALALALGAHLLPALARRQPVIWLLWLGCLTATLYGHAHFFAAAGARAGEQRAANASAPSLAAQAVQAELDAITARPLAQVAADHASATARLAQTEAAQAHCEQSLRATNSKSGCGQLKAQITGLRAKLESLLVEQEQARSAGLLRQRLAAEAQASDSARDQAVADPIDRALAAVTGLPASSVGLGAALAQALLLEMLAATLWFLALSPSQHEAKAPHAELAETAWGKSLISREGSPEAAQASTRTRWLARWRNRLAGLAHSTAKPLPGNPSSQAPPSAAPAAKASITSPVKGSDGLRPQTKATRRERRPPLRGGVPVDMVPSG